MTLIVARERAVASRSLQPQQGNIRHVVHPSGKSIARGQRKPERARALGLAISRVAAHVRRTIIHLGRNASYRAGL